MLNLEAAKKYFSETDKTMSDLLTSALAASDPVLLPTPKATEDYFANIVRSIVSQQISVAAAKAVNGRVLEALKDITPEAVNEIDFEILKSCGLSGKKTEYIKHNAGIWHTLPTQDFQNMSDEEIISELIKLYGIGAWTAEMFLMFSMARPDVFSYGDLGLMKGLYKNYNVRPHYVQKIKNIVDSWSPHKTIASLTLWHQLDNEPVLL